jgi:hypothetical protein
MGCSTQKGAGVDLTFTESARRLGIVSAAGTAFFILGYAATLVGGFLSLREPQQPIGDPWFSVLEILIILMMPLMVALTVAVHPYARLDAKVFSLMAIVFVSLLAGLTCSVHFVILTVGRQTAHSGFA